MTEATDLVPRATAEVDARRKLVAYALAVGVVAVGATAAATLGYPIGERIGLGWPGAAPGMDLLGGVVLWVALGLAGSFWSRELPSGAVITFHMPFVVAGAVLGGPVVGAWMGLVSEFELRELRRVPWYGVIANHAVVALAGISAGVLSDVATRGLAGSSGASPAGFGFFLVTAMAATGFVAVNFALVLPVVAMRGGMSLRDAYRTYDARLRATVVAEGVLAWLMALTYIAVGWWAPALCVVLTVVVWDAYERTEQMRHDPMTGLWNDKGFRPFLVTALRDAHQRSREAALLVIDLDGFGKLNKKHGMHVGDEMIIATAHRLLAGVRSTDVVARYNRAGDEFAVLLTGLPDASTAEMLAQRIRQRLLAPTRVRGTELQVSVGASVGVCYIRATSPANPDESQRTADRRMQYAKKHRLGVLAVDPEDLGEATA